MAARAPHGTNQPPKVIVRKIYIEGHGGGHHGGAWKVAYADFVTAMMAFFLLMWLLGATTEKQRKGIADYFAPTILDSRSEGIGGSGLFGGDVISSKSRVGRDVGTASTPSLVSPQMSYVGGPRVGTGDKGSLRNREFAEQDRKNFERIKRQVSQAMATNVKLQKLASHVKFVPTRDGLRIDLVDNADYSMFALGTTVLEPEADKLIGLIAESLKTMDNAIMIRGHTDSLGFKNVAGTNNWLLSSSRAEATRRRLGETGLPDSRFERIEGVADREPMITDNPSDPRNRRVAITLLYRKTAFNR
ncbi:flagellar motor protein MotB [Sphingomonas sp. 28-63-12]|uniref:flagellar motor protein MotB n=1 Tax=Sphingomonas sp. 28-63-12 TaxID=1970434 RepID=UPI000BDBBB9C|nr:MAG: flagellar motor protein [Sphingomonas sp. 28-63-12]